MQCVRCYNDKASQVAKAPDGSNAWVVFYCEHCNFSWRSSEEPETIQADKRDPYFQMKDVDMEKLMIPVPIPPLLKAAAK
jgi:vanillate/4-hydroxybenzoate decarboxylase subunit D